VSILNNLEESQSPVVPLVNLRAIFKTESVEITPAIYAFSLHAAQVRNVATAKIEA
jgi:hypothetical protein